MGIVLLLVAIAVSAHIAGQGSLVAIMIIFFVAWGISLFLNEKYINKYPQRYLSFLLASHIKAAISMGFFLWLFSLVLGRIKAPPSLIWNGFIIFILADALVSLIWRRNQHLNNRDEPMVSPKTKSIHEVGAKEESEITLIETWEDFRALNKSIVAFVEKSVPGIHHSDKDDRGQKEADETKMEMKPFKNGFIVSRVRFNDVRHLNKLILSSSNKIGLGGYFVGRYVPLENVEKQLRLRYHRFIYYPVKALHFIWYRALPKIPRVNSLYFFLTKGKNRVFSKTEIWGRMESCGLRVISEKSENNENVVIAQKETNPDQGKKPSYYPIVALERVGLNGSIIKAHKIRTMYPFSEYLQKRIFEYNSLDTTGKFARDFRITSYGRFLRKYWLDEIPQIWDWWRGDIKIVGLRAMSRHYFSLYPKEFQALYRKVKPGLIPPIFSESTSGFNEIVAVEQKYLEGYLKHPVRTDIRYLFATIKDILFKGVRSH